MKARIPRALVSMASADKWTTLERSDHTAWTWSGWLIRQYANGYVQARYIAKQGAETQVAGWMDVGTAVRAVHASRKVLTAGGEE